MIMIGITIGVILTLMLFCGPHITPRTLHIDRGMGSKAYEVIIPSFLGYEQLMVVKRL